MVITLNDSIQSESVLIITDNLNIGGYQRLALDQLYYLVAEGVDATLISLTDIPSADEASFIHSESLRINEMRLKIKVFPGSRLYQFICLRKMLNRNFTHLTIISHSLRASVILALARKSLTTSYTIFTTIHQVPSLSHKTQRMKRFFYAQFSDYIFGYSNAVVLDWILREKYESILYRFGISKEISLLRNGIYLPRIPEFQISNLVITKPRLIYIGRSTHWKGLSNFLEIIRLTHFKDFDFLILMPKFDRSKLSGFDDAVRKRIEILEGKTVADIQRVPGDVHIYPTQYGRDVELIEGISLNCIEMACMGIPSVISEHGSSTWTEKILTSFFFETNWDSQEMTVQRILSASERCRELSKSQIVSIRELFDISNQFSTYFSGKV